MLAKHFAAARPALFKARKIPRFFWYTIVPLAVCSASNFVAGQEAASQTRLDAVQKAQLAWAIISVFLLIVLLAAVILLIGRYARRQVRKPLPQAKPERPWYSKPLVPNADDDRPDGVEQPPT